MRQLIIILLAMLPLCARAQFSFDVPSVEAYIADHKTQKSLLLARSTLEVSNQLLHDYTATATADYRTLNVDLDTYTRAFDVIDILYQSTRTALNVRDTYNNVTETVGKYRQMLTAFYDKCIKRGNIETADTLIVTVNLHCIRKIGRETEALYASISDLVLYATGAAACSTADLMTVIEDVNRSLDNIRLFINTAYFETWRYIQLRMGYWKASVYRSVSVREIVDGAFGRWRKASYLNQKRQ